MMWLCRRAKPLANVRRQHRHRGWSNAWDPERLSERIRPNLFQPLDDLPRESRNSLEGKIEGDSAALVAARPLNLALLAPEITRILDRGLSAGHVEGGVRRVNQ